MIKKFAYAYVTLNILAALLLDYHLFNECLGMSQWWPERYLLFAAISVFGVMFVSIAFLIFGKVRNAAMIAASAKQFLVASFVALGVSILLGLVGGLLSQLFGFGGEICVDILITL